MSNEMIERIAKAICPYAGKKHPDCVNTDKDCRVCYANAHAAIEAMREPTEEMLRTIDVTDGTVEKYKLMIEAALK